MNYVFLISIILKGIGAILEIFLQILITHGLGVQGYGTYSTWISTADLIFWIFFSGMIKCNTFYLSEKKTSIQSFKKHYYVRYVLPFLMLTGFSVISITRKYAYSFVFIITGLELIVLDWSSVLIARRRTTVSLLGEYILGRAILCIGIIVSLKLGYLNCSLLMILYVVQYICVILFYKISQIKSKENYIDISNNVSLRKWRDYQKSDILQSMISQMPVVLQYFFSGGFEAGVVSIVLLVKKLVNFISGPTAKIFLPEFSRLYHAGDKEEISKTFSSIMHMQMLFVGPMSVVLIGFSNVVLKILAEELVEYSFLFKICSAVFLVAATLGPCGGLMQMTENEKKDNHYREIAILVMVVVMILFSKDRFFVLYGLCAQTAVESVGKYIFICKWLGKCPVNCSEYIKWWVFPIITIIIAKILKIQDSFLAMCILAGILGVATFSIQWYKKDGAYFIAGRRKD